MAETGSDRRQHPRVSIDAFVKVAGPSGDKMREFVFRTRDISKGGLFLFTRVGQIYPFKIGDTLRVELYDYDRFVELKGEIVRIVLDGSPEASQFPLGFGLRIVELSGDARNHFDSMLRRAAEGHQPY